MIYDLRHRTIYAYQDEVGFARCVLRLSPRNSARQTVLESSLTVTPQPSARREGTSPFGARVVTVRVDTPHRELVIESRARVDVHAASPPPESSSPPWESVRAAVLATRDTGPDGPASFLFPTPRTPITPQITDYARQSFPADRPILAAVAELNTRIDADFRYDSGATEVSTPVAEAFAARHGVCQDFAQVMIVGLRGLGLSAAYVSGYLRTTPPPGQPRLEGADATHAWVLVWCGDAVGWIGFDPTNGVLAGEDHIELAIGRDYADVAPIDGVILASGGQSLTVEVDVVPEEDVAAA